MKPETIALTQAAHELDPTHVGAYLGVGLIRGKVPMGVIAALMDTGEQTIGRWIVGGPSPRSRLVRKRLSRVTNTIHAALEQGVLPMEGEFDLIRLLPIWNVTKASPEPEKPAAQGDTSTGTPE